MIKVPPILAVLVLRQSRNLQRSHWAVALLCTATALPGMLHGQASLPPWISVTPGLEHPAAWAMDDKPLQFGLQSDTRWNGNAEPLNGLWFGAGWQPAAKGGYNRKGSDPVSFGVAFKEDPLSTGWMERALAISASASAFVNPRLKAHAGLSIGLSNWRLTPSSWSWNAQYGPGGFDPQSPSGEEWTDDANGGSRLDVAVSVGFSPARAARQKSQPAFRGALTLHHLSQGTAPHLSPIPLDSVRWRPSWWLEGQGEMGWENLQWRAWHRGTLQGSSHLLELGLTMGRSFGTSARFTKTRLSHHVETGVLWRSDGVLRLILGWERHGLRLNTGPAWSVGPTWRPAAGWSVGLSWTPDFEGALALHR